MSIRVDVDLMDYMARTSGAIHFQVRGADEDAAVRGLLHAKRGIFRIPHPEQPDEPYASFASDIERGSRGPGFWVDMADAEAYDGILDEALVRVLVALDESGVTDCEVTWPDGTCQTTTVWERDRR